MSLTNGKTVALQIGKKYPTSFVCLQGVTFTSLKSALAYADSQSWTKVRLAHSGVFYERRCDGWWKTSETESCDRMNGLPPEGVLIFNGKH